MTANEEAPMTGTSAQPGASTRYGWARTTSTAVSGGASLGSVACRALVAASNSLSRAMPGADDPKITHRTGLNSNCDSST